MNGIKLSRTCPKCGRGNVEVHDLLAQQVVCRKCGYREPATWADLAEAMGLSRCQEPEPETTYTAYACEGVSE